MGIRIDYTKRINIYLVTRSLGYRNSFPLEYNTRVENFAFPGYPATKIIVTATLIVKASNAGKDRMFLLCPHCNKEVSLRFYGSHDCRPETTIVSKNEAPAEGFAKVIPGNITQIFDKHGHCLSQRFIPNEDVGPTFFDHNQKSLKPGDCRRKFCQRIVITEKTAHKDEEE